MNNKSSNSNQESIEAALRFIRIAEKNGREYDKEKLKRGGKNREIVENYFISSKIKEKDLEGLTKFELENLNFNSLVENKVVNLYFITKDTVVPDNALDPEIWNIPEGYYAIDFLYMKKDNKIRRSEIIKQKDKIDRLLRIPYAINFETKIVDLYPINEDSIIPEEALDSEKWDVPEGYYAIDVE